MSTKVIPVSDSEDSRDTDRDLTKKDIKVGAALGELRADISRLLWRIEAFKNQHKRRK
jgi:hypothetical protein